MDTIEPQIKQETPKPEPVEATQPSAPVKEEHSHALRSKEKPTISKSQLKQQQYNVVVPSRLKPVPFRPADLEVAGPAEPQLLFVNETASVRFVQTEDPPFNRRGYKYKPCRPNPLFKSNLYSTTELPPYKVRPSYFDRAGGIIFNDDVDTVSTHQGWQSVRLNVGIREGTYYFEFDVINGGGDANAHVRVGIARKEASLEAPVGFDGYGYGIRDLTGHKMTLSRPKEFMTEHGHSGFGSGDTIGFLVHLPPLHEHRKAVADYINTIKEDPPKKKKKKDVDPELFNRHNNIVRDQIPIKYKSALYYEQFEYTPTNQMDHLLNPVTVFGEKAVLEKRASDTVPKIPGSRIDVYKNGELIDTMFENLYSFLPATYYQLNESISNVKQLANPAYNDTDDGTLGYYPMMSVFSRGVVKLNAGPDFKYPVPKAKALSERYDEHVVEEWLLDLIDEVEVEYLDSFEVD